MKITVVCEHNAAMDSEEGKKAYPAGMAESIAAFLRKAGNEVQTVRIDEKGADALTDEIIEGPDVMFWWGHIYHDAVADVVVQKVVDRAHRGMGMVFLHSAHKSKPFMRLTGAPGTLKWREDGEHERLWCVDMTHPIARGLGEYIDIPQEEMYGEPFGIPAPDELVYIGWFRGGEVMRGGCVFKRGNGKFFYFNPGHETYPTYLIPEVQKLLTQAAEYVAPQIPVLDGLGCPGLTEFSVND